MFAVTHVAYIAGVLLMDIGHEPDTCVCLVSASVEPGEHVMPVCKDSMKSYAEVRGQPLGYSSWHIDFLFFTFLTWLQSRGMQQCQALYVAVFRAIVVCCVRGQLPLCVCVCLCLCVCV
jgi:hypothetical protein